MRLRSESGQTLAGLWNTTSLRSLGTEEGAGESGNTPQTRTGTTIATRSTVLYYAVFPPVIPVASLGLAHSSLFQQHVISSASYTSLSAFAALKTVFRHHSLNIP
ncbi:hypothetical protein E2C01_068705 [Portunus trituberculatus]|uniref:Uncharacterized protein n=1 Tax=Portunus trituberculatus TaxID=210409 RepID=A0A5B7HYL9_PORTR|nr:hypothetical protein [Portunus trituberculatus]